MPAPRKDYSEAVELYHGGWAVSDLADKYCITRQAMHSILKRRGVEFPPNKIYKAAQTMTSPAPSPISDQAAGEREAYETRINFLESELASMTHMFHDACHDLGLINEALGLDPDDGGAEPILDAIAELKGERSTAQTTGSAPSDEKIFEIVANAIGNPLLAEDLKEGFAMHVEPEDWLKVFRIAAPMGGDRK